jgi:hypothetical protein
MAARALKSRSRSTGAELRDGRLSSSAGGGPKRLRMCVSGAMSWLRASIFGSMLRGPSLRLLDEVMAVGGIECKPTTVERG